MTCLYKFKKNSKFQMTEMTRMYLHFKELSKLLDAKHDKYERIYKTNRDVTQKCKKIIFTLHRIPGLSDEEAKKIMKSSSNEFRDIEQTLLKYIAMELRDGDTSQFLNAYTGGLQEYIEAVSFHYFLLKEQIISHSEIQNRVTFKGSLSDQNSDVVPLCVPVPQKEYMLGLGDLTGELMRFGIKSISVGDFSMCYKICNILKQINMGFLSLGYISSKDLFQKTCVFKSSLAKVEEACYSLQLRKTELPPEMLATFLTVVENEEENTSYI